MNIVYCKEEHTGYHPRLKTESDIAIGLVLRHGFCDFEIDTETTAIIEKDFIFEPSIEEQDYFYNEETGEIA